MTAIEGERSTDRLTCNFERGSTDEENCGDCVCASDEPSDGIAGEDDKCEGPVIWGV